MFKYCKLVFNFFVQLYIVIQTKTTYSLLSCKFVPDSPLKGGAKWVYKYWFNTGIPAPK